MISVETMTIEQINAMMGELRTRRTVMKSSVTVYQRQIATLARRREKLLASINAIDDEICELQGNPPDNSQPESDQQRTRRSQAEIQQCLEAILECARSLTVINRAMIIGKFHISPVTATAYLRQLCQEGKLVRSGERRAATYSLP